MRVNMFVSAVYASILFAVAPAAAETVSVRSGAATPVASSIIYNPDTCMYGALPEGRVTQAPAHGTVEARKFEVTVKPGERCAGKSFKGTMLVYTPARGYRGADSFSYIFSWETYTNSPGTSTRSGAVQLTVQ